MFGYLISPSARLQSAPFGSLSISVALFSDRRATRFVLGVACENPLSARAKRKHLKCLPAAASLHAGHGKPGHAVGSLAQQSRNGFIWNMSLDDIALDSRRVACGLRDV